MRAAWSLLSAPLGRLKNTGRDAVPRGRGRRSRPAASSVHLRGGLPSECATESGRPWMSPRRGRRSTPSTPRRALRASGPGRDRVRPRAQPTSVSLLRRSAAKSVTRWSAGSSEATGGGLVGDPGAQTGDQGQAELPPEFDQRLLGVLAHQPRGAADAGSPSGRARSCRPAGAASRVRSTPPTRCSSGRAAPGRRC